MSNQRVKFFVIPLYSCWKIRNQK